MATLWRAVLTAMEGSVTARAASASAQRASIDDRRCNYSLVDVALPERVDARVAAAREDRGFRSVSSDDGEGGEGEEAVEREVKWRKQLELHVVDMVRQVRLEPATLRKLLQVVGALMLRQQAEREQQLGSMNFNMSGGLQTSMEGNAGMKAATGVALNGPVARRILQEFHRVACAMGEDVYKRVKSIVMRSVSRGALSLDANTVRLESVFRLELRRQVTIDGVLERMVNSDADGSGRDRASSVFSIVGEETGHTNKRIDATSSSRFVVEPLAAGVNNYEPVRGRARSAPPITAVKRERVSSAHAFKMRSLERLLDAECERKGSSALSGKENEYSFYPLSAPALVATEAEHVQDKITAFLYHRSRENFPFWREPPENSLSREETARILRSAVTALLGSVMFGAGLSIEQLLEVLRIMKWRYLHEGQPVCVFDNEIEELIVLVEGELIVGTHRDKAPLLDTPDNEHESAASTTMEPSRKIANDETDLTPKSDTGKVASTSLLAPACVGEIGMIRAGERWPYTLTSSSATVKLLTISKTAFETLLLRLFSGGKSSTQTTSQQPQPPSERPVSSPGVFVNGRRRTQMISTLASSKNVLAIERQLAKSHSRRQEALQQGLSSMGGKNSDATEKNEEEAPSTDFVKLQPDQSQYCPVEQESYHAPNPTRTSPFQYYPSFNLRSDGSSGSSDVASLFRIKWAQPIAFEMQSSHDAVREEWAPPFPDTRAFVDYLSPSSQEAVRMLFDKPNLLSMAGLRSVCHRHPFLDGAYGRGRSRANAITPPTSPVKREVGEIDTVAFVAEASALLSPKSPVDQRRVEDISLTQFTEARKRMRSNSVSIRAMPSARSLLSAPISPMVSGRNASLEPYAGSTFVPESSFHTSTSPRRGGKGGVPEENNTISDEELDDNDNDQGPETKPFDSSSRRTSALTASTATYPSDPETEATLARKRALDSLTQSGEQEKRMSRLVNDEAAKQAIIRRHLEAMHGHVSPDKHSGNNSSAGESAQTSENPLQNSHAPLPLRVDLQKRMDSVLSSLQMRARAKLALVLKYTHADNYERFPIAVVLWEQATRFVQQREGVLAELRAFELVASDPRRHFRSLSTHRLQEQRQRDALFCRLNAVTKVCIEAMNELKARCGDEVYLDDRLYRDKMNKDYTEMLFEVEQERLQAIYRGVKPGFYLLKEECDSTQRCEDDREQASQRITKQKASLEIRIPTVSRELPLHIKSPAINETPWASNNNNADETDSSKFGADVGNSSDPLAVGGVGSLISQTRFTLNTPNESLYVPIEAQLHSKTTSEADQEAATKYDNPRPEDVGPGPSAPAEPRRGMNHRMAAQVRAQRQAELEELYGQVSSQKPGSRRPQPPHTASKADGEPRGGEHVDKAENEVSSLQHLLRAFVHSRDK